MRSKNDGVMVMASAEDDRTRWDERHRGQAPCIAPPIGVDALADALPTSGRALDVAYVSQHRHYSLGQHLCRVPRTHAPWTVVSSTTADAQQLTKMHCGRFF